MITISEKDAEFIKAQILEVLNSRMESAEKAIKKAEEYRDKTQKYFTDGTEASNRIDQEFVVTVGKIRMIQSTCRKNFEKCLDILDGNTYDNY